jgi:hypothetical protein
MNTSLLSSIAKQLMGGDEVELEGRRLRVRRTSRQRLRIVASPLAGLLHTSFLVQSVQALFCRNGKRPSKHPSPSGHSRWRWPGKPSLTPRQSLEEVDDEHVLCEQIEWCRDLLQNTPPEWKRS